MSHLPAEPHTRKRTHQESFARGIEQFNSEQFFDAHETWEEIWLKSPEPEKTFLQGIIQISAAFHHYGRGNVPGTRSLLEAGLRRVNRFSAVHNGIALEKLRVEAQEWVIALKAGLDPGKSKLPRIHPSQDRGGM